MLNQYNTFTGDPGRLEADLARTRDVTPAAVRAGRRRVAEHPEPRRHPLPSGEVGAAVERPDAGSVEAAAAWRGPAVRRARGEDSQAREWARGAGAGAHRPAEVERDAGHARGRGGRSSGQGRCGATDHHGHRPGDEDAQCAADRRGARRISGTTLTGGAGRESARVGLDVLKRNLAPALAIVADVVQNATFPEQEVAREKKRLLDTIAQQDRDPNALAARIRPILAFGPEHPYGRPVQGLRGTVEKITRDDLIAFRQARWKPASSALIFAGDVTLAEATALAKQHFGSWTGGAAAPITIPPPTPVSRQPCLPGGSAGCGADGRGAMALRSGAQVGRLRRADARRRRLGRRRLRHAAEPEPARGQGLLVRRVLGSRAHEPRRPLVGQRRRADEQDQGIAGGVRSRDEGHRRRQADLRKRSSPPHANGGCGDTRSSSSRWDGSVSRSRTTGSWGCRRRNCNGSTTPRTRATLAQALDAAKKYAKPEAATLLLVGDRSKIEAGVRELQLGEIVVLDAEGKPATAAAPGRTSQ